MNIFVLCAGRTASTTFSLAASKLDGFTSAHESRSQMVGEERLRYPANHIEVDNRLCWFLGSLDRAFPDARYVFIERDPERIAQSYLRRWNLTVSIVRAFGVGVLMKNGITADDRLDICRHYVKTAHENIETFIHGRPHYRFDLGNAKDSFEGFCKWLEVPCSEEIRAVWDTSHNLNLPTLSATKSSRLVKKVFRALQGLPAYVRDV